MHVNETPGVHTTWYAFCDYFKKWYYTLVYGWRIKNDKMIKSKRKYRQFDIRKVFGYTALCRIDKFIKKHPEIIKVDVDDSYHTSSSIYLIPHKDEKLMKWHGITVLNVPQCSPEQNTFFLYPHSLDDLIKELIKLQKEMRIYEENGCRSGGIRKTQGT